MYIVTNISGKILTMPKHLSHIGTSEVPNNWAVGQTDLVDDEMIDYYRTHTDAFTIGAQVLPGFPGVTSLSAANALTAHAGGGQANALALAQTINRITTVATAADSVKLPVSTAGMSMIVINDAAANAAAVFPATGEAISPYAANAAFSLGAKGVLVLYCAVAGTWNAMYYNPVIVNDAYNTNAATTSATLTAANISGGDDEVTLNLTGTLGGAANATLPLAADLWAAIPNATVGTDYKLRIINSSAGAFAWTVLTNTGWTLAGTMTIAQNNVREFYVTLGAANTATLQSIGDFAIVAV